MKRYPSALFTFLVAATLGLFAPRHLSAQVVYVSNLADVDDSGVVCDANSWDAAEFTTGVNAGGFRLDSIQIAIDGILITDGSGFTLSVYSNNAGQPGSIVGGLSGSSNPSTPGTYTYTPYYIGLASATSYWIVGKAATASPNGSFLWGDTTSSSYTASGGWTINNATRDISHDGGATWTSTGVSLLRFNVTANAVPEPQTLALVGSGLAIVFFRRRKLSC